MIQLERLGDMQTSPTVTIRGNTAPVTGVPTLDSANGGTDYDDEDLTATAAATTDADTRCHHEHFPLDKEWCFTD